MLMKSRIMPIMAMAALMSAAPSAVIGSPRFDAGAGDVEKLLAQVQVELKRVTDEVKKTAEDALKQAKDSGTLSAELKASADKGLTQLTALSDAATKLQKKVEELDDRGREVEQKLADVAKHRSGIEEVKSLGLVVASDADLKAFVAKGAKGSLAIKINQAITSLTTSGGDLIAPDREREIVRIQRRQMTVRQLLTQGRTLSNLVQYAKQTTRTNNAAVVSETVQKPESTYVWDLAEAAVRTIAHFVIVARQTMDDAAQLQTEIDSELRYGLDYAEEVELLSGSGAGQHLSGLITNATAFSAAFTPSNKTMIDDLRLAMLQASLAEFPADGMVLHPTDWARIELTKDGEQRYIWANPRALGGPTLWGLPVVPTQAITVDKFLVGAFRAAATIYDRMDAEVLVSSEDGDNFKKNLLTIRAEKRLALAVKRPLALTYGDFGNV